jgi:hypothetical protein
MKAVVLEALYVAMLPEEFLVAACLIFANSVPGLLLLQSRLPARCNVRQLYSRLRGLEAKVVHVILVT